MRKSDLPTPYEADEQRALMDWAALQAGAHPELRLLYHIPNEGKRLGGAGARAKRQGLRKGVPDLCLPVARGGYHGLYIELKRRRMGRVSDAQRDWLCWLGAEGYRAVVCYGMDAARNEILRYLRG